MKTLIKERIVEKLDQITDESVLIKIYTMVDFWFHELKCGDVEE